MAKRMQEQKEEDGIVTKSKPTAMNLTSTVSTSSSSVNHPIASKSPGYSKHPQRNLTRGQEEIQKPDAASSFEVAEKPAATDKSQESWEFSESESWSNHEKEVTGKLVASVNSGNSWNSKAGSRKQPHNFHMSPAAVPHMEKVFSIVRQTYGRSPTDDLNDLDENNAIW